MRREYFLILGGLLIAPVAAGAADGSPVQLAASERPFSLIPTEPVGRLTVTEARNLVAHWLRANGQQTGRHRYRPRGYDPSDPGRRQDPPDRRDQESPRG